MPRTESRVVRRLLCAAIVAVAASWYTLHTSGGIVGEPRGDFATHWMAARAVLHGVSPYDVVAASGWAWPYLYPGTTPVIVSALAWLPLGAAQSVFVGLSVGILAFAVTGRYWWGLLILLTPSFFHGFYHAQWTPLLVGLMLLPVAGGLLVVKPTTGLAYFIARPSVAGAAVGATLVLFSLLVWPSWPHEWRLAISGASHIMPPLARPGGFLLLLALPWWRRSDARLIAGLACVPHLTMLYETLPLFTVARSFRQMATLVVLAALGSWLILRNVPIGMPDLLRNARQWPYLLAFFYLPSLTLVILNNLRRPAPPPAIISQQGEA